MFRNQSKKTQSRISNTSRRRTGSRKRSSNWVAMLFLQVIGIVAFVGLFSAAQEARQQSPPERVKPEFPALVDSEFSQEQYVIDIRNTLNPRNAHVEYDSHGQHEIEISQTRFDNFGDWR